jgi:type VI secretion system protein ImpK
MLGDTQMNGPRHAPGAGQEYNSASGLNPLVWAANPLLDMIPQIRAMHQLADPALLRNQLVTEIKNFEQRAQSVGVPREDLIGARYCLCTVLDEVAALTPWGSHGIWAKQSLLVSFHNETWGGEKYYLLLARLAQNPERHKNLIELLYYCNALGFEGRFRIENNGYTQLEILKKRISTILNNTKGDYENRLSPHWQGVSSTPPAWRMIPPWVVAMLCALIGAGIYILFLFSLNDRLHITYEKLSALKIPVTEAPPPALPPPPSWHLCDRLKQQMDRELVTVAERGKECHVSVKGDGLFESGSATIRTVITLRGSGGAGGAASRTVYLENVINSVADAILNENDPSIEAVVRGYTDNIPIRTARFPNNDRLSQERAESVKKMLDTRLGNTSRTKAEGYGPDDPVADNGTPEGRAKNRRVEILIRQSLRQSGEWQPNLTGANQ